MFLAQKWMGLCALVISVWLILGAATADAKAKGKENNGSMEEELLRTEVAVRKTPWPQVQFISGNAVYIEALMKGRWVGRYWSADGHVNKSRFWDNDAFEIRIKDTPTPSAIPGTLLSSGWQWVSESELPRTDRGARHIVVKLSRKNPPISVTVHTLLDGTPALKRWLEVTNASDESLALTAVSPWSGRLWSGDAPITLGHSTRWADQWNGWFGWTPLSPGTNVFKQDRGLAWDDPYFVLRNESNGEYFFGELAWSANYTMEFQKSEEGLSFKVGPTAVNALRVIAPGETIATPAVHLGYIKKDFDAAVQAMHDHIRRSVLPKRSPRHSYLVQYLFPEDQPLTVYRGDDYNETTVKKCMDVAAAVGIEVFIVDGPTWCTAYGNWLAPDPKRFPNGLAPLVEYAHQKGLLFGLYAEPEGGREGYQSGKGVRIGNWSESRVFQEHPDWFVQPGSVLNLSISEAADYMQSELAQMIEHYKLDLYRHDFNSPLRGQGSETLRQGFMENDYWRHYEAFYCIFERLHAKYPDLILQQAAAGGSRQDLGTVGRFHEQYTSDRAAYPDMYQMAGGMTVNLPPETLVAPNGMAGPNQPDFVTMLRAAYALGHTPMIFNAMLPRTLEEFKEENREKFAHYNGIYKTFIRPMLATCKVYHHAPVNATGGVESASWFAMEFVSPDRKKGWATIIRLADTADQYLFKPRGLDPKREYRVTFDNTGQTQRISGANLQSDGLLMRPPRDPRSELLLFEAQ